jgi:hypothetical protein
MSPPNTTNATNRNLSADDCKRERTSFRDYLTLDPPFKLQCAPEAYAISRQRELTAREINWDFIYGYSDDPDQPAPGSTRNYESAHLRRYLLSKLLPDEDLDKADRDIAAMLLARKLVRPVYPWDWSWDLATPNQRQIQSAVVACMPVLQNVTFERLTDTSGVQPTDEEQKLADRGPIVLRHKETDPPIPPGSGGADDPDAIVKANFQPLLTDSLPGSPPEYTDEWAPQQSFVFCISFNNGSRWRYFRPYTVTNHNTSEITYLTLAQFLSDGFKD